jgi:hypothetical protein
LLHKIFLVSQIKEGERDRSGLRTLGPNSQCSLVNYWANRPNSKEIILNKNINENEVFKINKNNVKSKVNIP